KPQSTESLKAEVCPWEAQEPKSSDKANICPWEGAEPPSGKEKARPSTVSKSLSASQGLLKETGVGPSGKEERAKRDRESVCPWESTDMEQIPAKPRAGSTEPAEKSQSTESLKAEICPWEDQEPKSSDRAEICPWEGAEPQLEKGAAPGKDRVPPQEASKPVEKG
ncbi:GP179 protein, partial [Neopipo cinnamomea]|nr:GP179 protein [Neopipo cinnamomea]